MTVTDRGLPHNLEAERAVLGGVLVDNTMFPVAAALVTEGTFFRKAHALIWRALASVLQRGEPADLVTARDELARRGDLDEVGGAGYVSGLIDGVPLSINVESYARIVGEHAARRALVRLATELTDAAYEGAEAPGTLLDGIEAQIAATRDRLLAGPSSAHAARRVADEVDRQRAQREARRQLDAEERGPVPMPELRTLRDRLSEPREPVTYRIADMQPRDSRVVLAAQYKGGKTTLVGNLLRSLADGDLFLNHYAVTPLEGAILLIDTEMGDRQLDAWLDAQAIRNTHRVIVVTLRGFCAAFNLLDVALRAHWASYLRMAGVVYVVLDCLRPVLDALGLDEHKEAGRFLVAFDALLNEATVRDALVVHHMGHMNERARGDSRIRDWPDVEWRLVRQDDDPASARYLSTYGRDVDRPEAALTYDPSTRRLRLTGGTRQDATVEAALVSIEDRLRKDTAPLGVRAIQTALADTDHPRDVIRAAIRLGVTTGRLVPEPGPHNAILHRVCERASVCEQRAAHSANECAGAYIDTRTRTHTPDASSVRGAQSPCDPLSNPNNKPQTAPFDAQPFLDEHGQPTRRPGQSPPVVRLGARQHLEPVWKGKSDE